MTPPHGVPDDRAEALVLGAVREAVRPVTVIDLLAVLPPRPASATRPRATGRPPARSPPPSAG